MLSCIILTDTIIILSQKSISPLSSSQVLHLPLVEISNRPIKFWSKIVPRVCITNQTFMHASISGFLVGTVQDFLDSCALCRLRDSRTGSMHQILCQPDLARKKTQSYFLRSDYREQLCREMPYYPSHLDFSSPPDLDFSSLADLDFSFSPIWISLHCAHHL